MTEIYQINGKKKSNIFQRISLTNKLIIINIITYIASLIIVSVYGDNFYLRNIAITPSLILSGKAIWTFVTSMFSHLQFFHLFANMLSLFFIGNFLEKIIGRKRFFWVYILAGLIGGVFFVGGGVLFGNDAAGVGASGAIFGLLGVLAVLVPFSKIYLIAGPLIVLLIDVILTPFIPANLASIFHIIINVLIVMMLFGAFSFNKNVRRLSIPLQLPMWLLPIVAIVPLVIIGFFVALPIGNSAHIGGLIVGLIYGFILKVNYPNKAKLIRNQFR
jgi:membrane associated rhomboid family serine protease